MTAAEMIRDRTPAATDHDTTDRAFTDLEHAMERADEHALLEWIADYALTLDQARAGIRAFFDYQDERDQ